MPSNAKPTDRSLQALGNSFLAYSHRANSHIHRVNNLLSTTSSLDATLCTVTYTITFLQSLTPSSSAPFARFLSSLPPLNALLSETRIIFRLWGLLPIYTWAVSAYNNPPKDIVLRYLEQIQILFNIVFQLLENLAFLGDKGILALREKRRAKFWMWSSRAWAGHVFLELARLSREAIIMREADMRTADKEKEEKVEDRKINQEWYRSFVVNVAYAPMTLHWSFEQGLLNEGLIGAFGILAGALGLREAWRQTA